MIKIMKSIKIGEIFMNHEKLFYERIKKNDVISVGVLMDLLNISRPTATNLIYKLLLKGEIKHFTKIGSITKWYQRK